MVYLIQDQDVTLRVARLSGGAGYFASADETPGCWGWGETQRAAVEEWIEVYREWTGLPA